MKYRIRDLSDEERRARDNYRDMWNKRIKRAQQRRVIDEDLATLEEKYYARTGQLDEIMEKYDSEHGYIIEEPEFEPEQEEEESSSRSTWGSYGKIDKTKIRRPKKGDPRLSALVGSFFEKRSSSSEGELSERDTISGSYGERKPKSSFGKEIRKSAKRSIKGWILLAKILKNEPITEEDYENEEEEKDEKWETL